MNKDAEIRGFIYADGCFSIIRQKRKRKYKDKTYEFINYIPRINITQRADNLPFLEAVKARYGGWISENKSNPKSNPVFYWSIQGFEGCSKMLDFLVRPEWPYAKLDAARLLNEFVKWRIKIGYRKFKPKEMDKIEEWHRQMRIYNSYRGSNKA